MKKEKINRSPLFYVGDKYKLVKVDDFVQVTLSKRNFEDMKNYTAQVVDDFRNKLM